VGKNDRLESLARGLISASLIALMFGVLGLILYQSFEIASSYKNRIDSTVPIERSPATVTHVDINDGKVGLKYIADKKVRGAIVFTGEESAKYTAGDNVCFNGSYIASKDEMVVNEIVECQ
jgi:hypothetical protein